MQNDKCSSAPFPASVSEKSNGTVSYRVRKAVPSDAAMIESLVRAVRVHPGKLDYRRFVVAISEDGSLLGCVQLKPHDSGILEMASAAVEKSWRGKGVSTSIAKYILENYSPPIWGTCMDRMIPFYRHFGGTLITDNRKIPAFLRRRRFWFNLFLKLKGRKGRLVIMTLNS